MSEEPTTVIEKTSTPEAVAFNDKHLEAAFAFRAKHHKSRILKGFGANEQLPRVDNGQLDTRIVESEKQFKKAYDLLNREQPSRIEIPEDGVSRDSLIALADTLAWKGIEGSVVAKHLDDVKAILRQLGHNGKQSEAGFRLGEAMKALKSVVIEDGHFYRDFFDSEIASSLGADSPAILEKMLNRVSMYGANGTVEERAKGISLEIAARRYISDAVDQTGEEAIVEYGSVEEDKKGGDIVVVRDSNILFIDLKSFRPDEMGASQVTTGYSLSLDSKSNIYKATVWPESKQPVAHDSFRLNDVVLKRAIQKLLLETR